MSRVAVGLRAKTGRAIAVVLAKDGNVPKFVWRGEVSLVDPSMTIGPYHTVMDLPWNEATVAVQPLVAAIQEIATNVVRRLIDEHHIEAVGVVGSPSRDLARIGNPHIRAHAAEGVLFREVLEVAAKKNHLPCFAFSDREIAAHAHPAINEMKRVAGAPWRADERMAGWAAWAALR